jgi:hypothetical protein
MPAGNEILRIVYDPAIVEALGERVVAAAVDAEASARCEEGACRHVEHARRAQPVLGRQRAREQGQATDEVALQDRTEAGNALGEENAVYPGLGVRVLVAHMVARIAGG